MQKLKYTEQQINEAIRQSKCIAETLRVLGLKPVGGNYSTIKKYVMLFNIDVSHFPENIGYSGNFLSNPKSPESVKNKLLRETGHQCNKCKLTEWLGSPIMLELEHINGNSFDNSSENLELLCPNCHSQTPTWRRKKSSFEKKPIKTRTHKKNLCKCKKEKNITSKVCKTCYIRKTKITWPSSSELITLIQNNKYVGASKILNVSDNAIRHHLHLSGINPKTLVKYEK